MLSVDLIIDEAVYQTIATSGQKYMDKSDILNGTERYLKEHCPSILKSMEDNLAEMIGGILLSLERDSRIRKVGDLYAYLR
ncbi:MAG: hypothetical protein V1802_01810 [Candidatus Aenigmatarchaeota archaeon]